VLAHFQRFASQRSVDADGNLRLDLQLNRCTLSGRGSALRTRDSFGPEIDVRARRVESLLEGSGELRVGGKTRLSGGVSRSLIAFNASEVLFDRNLRQALDRTVDTASLAARHALTPLTTVIALADVQHDRFPFSPLRDANGSRVLAGFEFRPHALIAGQAHVGYRRFISRDATQPNVAGVVASIDVSHTFTDVLRFGLRVQRDLAHSYSLEERYFASTDMRLVMTKRVSHAWDVTATVRRLRLVYRGTIAPPRVAKPADDMFGYGGAIEHRVGSAMTIGVDGEYYRRESELTGRKYDRVRLVSSLGYRF
jgi:hypothetical protein